MKSPSCYLLKICGLAKTRPVQKIGKLFYRLEIAQGILQKLKINSCFAKKGWWGGFDEVANCICDGEAAQRCSLPLLLAARTQTSGEGGNFIPEIPGVLRCHICWLQCVCLGRGKPVGCSEETSLGTNSHTCSLLEL